MEIKHLTPARNKPLNIQAYTTYSDLDIIDRVMSGDRALFELIMRRYNRRLFRVARGIIKNDTLAQDIVQEAYINAYKHLDSFKGPKGFSAWLIQITVREALKLSRKESHLRALTNPISEHPQDSVTVTSLDNNTDTPRSNPAEEPENSTLNNEVITLVAKALDKIPQNFRMVFILREVEGLSIDETAEALSVNPSTVKTRLFRAKLALRRQLTSQYKSAKSQLFPFGGHQCDIIVAKVMKKISTS